MYEPREDSFLLRDTIKGIKAERALDMGTGSGIIARELAKSCGGVLACDIDDLKLNDINFVRSDLFERIEGSFDVITWNAPYLPGNEYKDLDCGDGKIILKFFEDAKKHLFKNGRIFVLLSSLSPVGQNEIEELGYSTEIAAKKKVAFEELFVIEARQN